MLLEGLLTLAHLGYVASDRKRFGLTPKVLRLGQSYLHSARLPRVVQSQLQRIAYALQEASSAGILQQDDIMAIAAASAGRVVSATLQPGIRVPAYCTSNGRVLVSAMQDAEMDAWLARQRLEPLTPHTITEEAFLLSELADIRAGALARSGGGGAQCAGSRRLHPSGDADEATARGAACVRADRRARRPARLARLRPAAGAQMSETPEILAARADAEMQARRLAVEIALFRLAGELGFEVPQGAVQGVAGRAGRSPRTDPQSHF